MTNLIAVLCAMSAGAFAVDRSGLDHASPVLLELLERAVNDLSNNPLLQDEHTSATDGAAVETNVNEVSDPPAQDDKKQKKHVKGKKGALTSPQTQTAGKESPVTASAPLPADNAVCDIPEATDPGIEDDSDQQIELIHAKARSSFLLLIGGSELCEGALLTR